MKGLIIYLASVTLVYMLDGWAAALGLTIGVVMVSLYSYVYKK